MTSSQDGEAVARAVGSAIRPDGYRRRGMQSARAAEHGCAVIHVQTWRRTDSTDVTVNIALYSLIVARFVAEPVPDHQPSYLRAHWGRRIGNLYGTGSDRWWNAEDPAAVADLVDTVVAVAVPKLAALLEPRALRDDYLEELDWTIGKPRTTLYAAILSAHLGEPDRAAGLAAQLEEDGYPSSLVPHLDRLRRSL